MHAANAIRNVAANEGTATDFDVIFAAQKDASEIAYLEGILRTTMRMTSDATTRRAIRIKLDAMEAMRAGTMVIPNAVPTFG